MDKVINTGIEVLDQEMGGGIPFPHKILITGPSGSGKTRIVDNIVVNSLRAGISVVQLCLDYLSERVRGMLKQLGIMYEQFEGRFNLILIEGYAGLAGVKSEERFTTTWDPTDISINISKALELLRDEEKLLVIDSLTSITDALGHEKTMQLIRTLSAKTSVLNTGLIATVNSMAISSILKALLMEVFEGIIELDIKEEVEGLRRRVRIVKMPKIHTSGRWIDI